jgi:signal transduction histidine kinase
MEELGALIPALYQTILDKVTLRLIVSVTGILNDEKGETLTLDQHERISGRLRNVCEVLSDAFDNLETSVFLEDPAVEPGVFRLQGTNWQRDFRKPTRRRADPGLTAWVLLNEKPVILSDLKTFHDDLDHIRRKYPGITRDGSLQIVERLREYLNLAEDDETPPVAFMAAPIKVDEQVVGVIRCVARRTAPFGFGESELSLLQLVATEIGATWTRWMVGRNKEAENQTWHQLVQSVTKFNSWMHEEITAGPIDKRAVFEEGLKMVETVIGGAQVMDIRLFDRKTNQLYFFVTTGDAWNAGTVQEVAARRKRRYDVAPDSPSPGVQVFLNGKAQALEGLDADPDSAKAFPDIQRMIIAPIIASDRVFGVLDIRRTIPQPFPPYARPVAELIGLLMGLYSQVEDMRTAIAVSAKAQIQANRILAHQLRLPVTRAFQVLKTLKAGASSHEDFMSGIEQARALVQSARRVSLGVQFFADLTHNRPPRMHAKVLTYHNLVPMLVNTANDYQTLFREDQLAFVVDRSSFDCVSSVTVKADLDLLEQCINNIFDNAGKYSFAGTSVRISGDVLQNTWLCISTINTGLRIQTDEVETCKSRGWRGADARTTAPGSGLGLWVTNHIAEIHGGKLVIRATSGESLTEVSLLLPIVHRVSA